MLEENALNQGIFVAVVAFVLIGWQVAKVALLNREPLQQELASLILEMMAKGADSGAQDIFWVSSTARFLRHFVTDETDQRKRLAHALSMIKPRLSPSGYARAKQILRSF